MQKKHGASKKLSISDKNLKHRSNMDMRGQAAYSDRDERIYVLRDGKCKVGVCGTEAACKPYTNNTYTCLCPHDSQPPTKDDRCPRNTVPLVPKKIENILPPQINETKAHTTQNTTTKSLLQPTTTPLPENPIQHREIVLITGLAVALIITVIIVIWRRSKHCSKRNKNSTSPSPIVLKRSLLLADRYTPNPQYSSFITTTVPLLKRENLDFLKEIGEGCFGKVYKGHLFGENSEYPDIVAIKVLKESPTLEAEEDFFREVDIMSAFKHSNILSLLGVVAKEETVSPMMVFEYMPHGDLAEVLRLQSKRREPENADIPDLTLKQLLSIALQIASGMKYLAAQRFVHRDLACRNCLVTDGPIVKIADFGMSRDVYTCDYYKIGGSRLLPVRWMSPESVMYGRFTLESDIWSYGIVLWEIYSFGKQPYYGHTNEEVVKLILQGIMLIPPEDCPPVVCELMQNCWKTDPRDRIRFSDIHDKLDKFYENFDETEKISNFKIEIESKTNTLKKLPRPPPLHIVPKLDLLDAEGYLLPKEIKKPVQYLETLPD